MARRSISFYSILSGFCRALNRSKPPMLLSNLSLLIFFPRIAFGPDSAIFSMCWCCDRTANRFTCTGIGTTILFVFEPLPPPVPRPMPCDVKPAFTRFHFARRFWNQIFTCNSQERTNCIGKSKWLQLMCRLFNAFTWTSLSFRLVAIWLRSVRLKYFLAWNSRSNSSNCSDVNAVRRRRDFKLCFECVLFDSFVFSSPEHSLSDWSEKMEYGFLSVESIW